MRLFAAVWPPAAVRSSLAAALDAARRDDPMVSAWGDVRWVSSERWHVTIGFFGEIPDPEHGALRASLGRAVRSLAAPPVAVVGEHIVLLGPRVLHLEVDGLAPLARAVRREAGPWRRDEHPGFRGHLTLGRLAGGGRPVGPGGPEAGGEPEPRARPGRRPLPAGLPRPLGPLPERRWGVEELHLVASWPDGAGPRYEVVATYRVGAP
ncbi:MAG TPA: 2'-5' RNA ligase family protein [Acidimicrobiales bacterium]